MRQNTYPKYMSGWQTSDGAVWESPTRADEHQTALDFAEWLYEHTELAAQDRLVAHRIAMQVAEAWGLTRRPQDLPAASDET